MEQPCELVCTSIFALNVVTVKHSEHHHHPRPPVKKLSPAALRLFETVVTRDPDLGPQKLQIGGTTQTPVDDLDDSFCTVGQVNHYQKDFITCYETSRDSRNYRVLGSVHEGYT